MWLSGGVNPAVTLREGIKPSPTEGEITGGCKTLPYKGMDIGKIFI